MLKKIFICLFALLAVNLTAAQDAPGIVIEGDQEVLYLNRMFNTSEWITREATKKECQVSPSSMECPVGKKTVAIKFAVDYTSGYDKEHLIGYPQAWFNLKGIEKDWSKWENIEFMAFVKSNRRSLPNSGLETACLGTIEAGKSPSETGSYEIAIPFEKKEQWQPVKILMTKIEDNGVKTTDVGTLIFSITERKYADKDNVEFYLGGFRLTRTKK